MRVARLLSIVFELDARPGSTAAELAADLGVSVRTVYRDVAALQAAGIPVYGVAGRNGGLHLVEGYRSRAATIRAGEAAALLAGVVPGAAADLGLGDDADRAVRKVRSQSGAAADDGQVLVDPIGWYRTSDEVPHLALVVEAMRTHRVVAIRYSRWEEPTEVRRRIAPHGVVLKAGAWYVVARSRRRMRTFRVGQIATARLTSDAFEPDPDFDLTATWAAFVASFRERLHVIDAEAELDDAAVSSLRRDGDPAMLLALDRSTPVDDRPGWTAARLPYESIERAAADLLRLGLGARATGPPALVAHLAEVTAALATRYAT